MRYIANVRFPTEKAHGIQIAKTCEALLQRGVTLELWVPKRHTPITDTPETYYGLSRDIPTRRFGTLDTVRFGRLGFILQSLTFAYSCARALRGNTEPIYCRDEIVLWTLSYISNVPFIWESHDGSWNIFARRAAHCAKALVVVTEGAKALYLSRGIPAEKVHVIRNGIDLVAFQRAETKEVARARLGLSADARIALYVGRLDGWKGTKTLFEAADVLSKEIQTVIIGGEAQQVKNLSRDYPSVRFLGYRPYAELASNLAAADVLVLPNTAQSGISFDLTSPLKLMGYMAAGRPIVASDIPSVRELVDETSAYLVKPDDAKALAQGIQLAFSSEDAVVKAAEARRRAEALDWSVRAERIQGILADTYA